MSGAAEALWRARVEGGYAAVEAGERPPDVPGAYALQRAVDLICGTPRVGWKLGATATASLELLGLDEPFVAPVYERFAHANGERVALHAEHGPALETEFAVRLGADIPARDEPYTAADVADAVDAVLPAFEVIGCRLPEGLAAARHLLIADGGANVAIVIGEARCDWRTLDLRAHPLTVSVDGAEPGHGHAGLLVWGGPIEAIAWLANHAVLGGAGLRAGELVLTGTCAEMIPIAVGSEAVGDFGALGEVRARFS